MSVIVITLNYYLVTFNNNYISVSSTIFSQAMAEYS